MILQSDTYHFYCTRMLERGNPGEKTPRRSRALLGRGSGHVGTYIYIHLFLKFMIPPRGRSPAGSWATRTGFD